MAIGFKKAFILPFNDEKWTHKTGVCFLLLVPGLISSMALGVKNPLTVFSYFILASLIGGYIISSAHNEVNSIEPVLPDWDFAQAAINTLKSWVINLAYTLILIPALLILFAIASVDKSYIIISAILAIPFFIAYFLFVNVAFTLFYENLEIGSAFYFKKILQLLKVGYLDYIYASVLCFVASFAYAFVGGFLGTIIAKTISVHIGTYIQNVTQVLSVLISANLIAQAYKEARLKL